MNVIDRDQAMDTSPQVLELRQYSLHPGRRDELISLFEQELVLPQEAVGMRVLGTFRDLDDPNRFVWVRGFPDMESRRESLAAFYGGAVWQKHRDAANATMLDSDDVLLLRPGRPESSGLGIDVNATRDAAEPRSRGTVLVAIAQVGSHAAERQTLARFEATGLAALVSAGLPVFGYFVTESAENTFPALPVREGERVFVCVCAAARDEQPLSAVASLVDAIGHEQVVVLRLEPTPASLLDVNSPACAAARVRQESS